LKIEDANMPEKMDATDGLAAAVCHFYQTSNPLLGTKSNSWKSFISSNPDRIIKK
jgi:crossover junction endodeoxyribonuclease RuvC